MVKLSDYFNSTTIKGRANVAKATYASIAALYILTRYKRSKKKALTDPHSAESNGIDKGDFKCPRCECNQATTDDNNHSVHDAEPSLESKDQNGPCFKQHDNHSHDIAVTSVGEAIVKTSKAACDSGCNAADTQFVSNNSITEKLCKLNEENDNLIWWYTF